MRTAIERGKSLTLQIDGQAVTAFEGETIAAVLLARGQRVFRRSAGGQPRGLFCGMGICYDCLVTVNGTANLRACMTPVADGMVVDTHSSLTVEV
jgi:predicted molibdopterin-dependent oxidoreductase YjgC